MPSLIVTEVATSQRKRIEVKKYPFRIGRAKTNDLILPQKIVSGLHCQLELGKEALIATDLGSKTGTELNGRPMKKPAPFHSGDVLSIGGFKVELLAPESRLEEQASAAPVSPPTKGNRVHDLKRDLRRRIHTQLQTHPDLVHLDFSNTPAEEIRKRTRCIVEEILDKEQVPASPRPALIRELLDEALGYGPLEELLADESVDEIMVNNFDTIFVERQGKIAKTELTFTDVDQLMNILRRILGPIGRRIDESSPMVDARLPDGSRVNAIIPPLSLIGPLVTIRKFPQQRMTVHDLIDRGTLTKNMAVFLQLSVKHRKNILISGGTGSGKTTLLNILSSFIPRDERIVTIEDAAELRLQQPHVLPLEGKPPNIEGKGAIPVRKLLMNALRMRPDRIIIGECRGEEALDMLQAMNTGHDGSLTTLHANSARDALSRLETLVLMAGMDLPVQAIREQIASAIDLLVHQQRMPDGSRKIVSIEEITGREMDVILLNDLFRFDFSGLDEEGQVRGAARATGAIPKFVQELRARGVPVDLNLFKE